MIVRRRVARGLAKKGSTEEEPTRERAKRFLLIVLSAGALSGLAALLGIPPFGNVQAVVNQVLYSSSAQIEASQIFPPVKPVNQVIDVYDPPPAGARPQPPATSLPSSPPHATPHPTPGATPSATPRDE